jgi:hypothetical protein
MPSLCQTCSRLLHHSRIVVIKVQPQDLPPHMLITSGLHNHSNKGNQQHMAST